MAKDQNLATADSLVSLAAQYGVAKTLLKNNGVDIPVAVNESDLKKAKGTSAASRSASGR